MLRRLHSRPKLASHAGVSRELVFPLTPQARALALITLTVQAKSRLSTNCLQYASPSFVGNLEFLPCQLDIAVSQITGNYNGERTLKVTVIPIKEKRFMRGIIKELTTFYTKYSETCINRTPWGPSQVSA